MIGDYSFEALLLPDGARLPPEAASVVDQFRQQGGRVLVDGAAAEQLSAAALHDKLDPPNRIAPASERIVLGRFRRDGRQILLVVNSAKETYRGKLATDPAHAWLLMDPATGTIQPVATDPAGQIGLELEARWAVLLIEAR